MYPKKLRYCATVFQETLEKCLRNMANMSESFNPFSINVPLLYPLKKSENRRKHLKKRSNSFSSTLIFKVKSLSATIATVSWIILWKFAERKSLDNSKLIIAITHYLLDTAHKIIGSMSLTHLFPIHPNASRSSYK